MEQSEDAYGESIRTHRADEGSFEVVERDDGYVGPPGDPARSGFAFDTGDASPRGSTT
jgi:hypothetical protein